METAMLWSKFKCSILFIFYLSFEESSFIKSTVSHFHQNQIVPPFYSPAQNNYKAHTAPPVTLETVKWYLIFAADY